jgi:hypothetical protein
MFFGIIKASAIDALAFMFSQNEEWERSDGVKKQGVNPNQRHERWNQT